MNRNICSLLEKKEIIILIGEQDKKLKDDFVSFFNIKRYRVFDIEKENLPILKKFLVVLCTWDKERSNQILNKAGMRYKRDYVLAEDLFRSIDLDIVRDCRKFYAYVGGKGLKDRIYLYYHLYLILHHICKEELESKDKDMGIEAVRIGFYALMLVIENVFRRKIVFCKTFDNKNITKKDFLCISGSKEDEDRMLYEEGIVKGRKIYTVQMLEKYCFASRLLRKTYLDKRQNKCGCVLPYEMFYINPEGNIWLCPCFGELTVSNLIGNSAEEAWNSTIAKIMRLSIENNTYTFCDRRCKSFWKNEDGVEVLERKKIRLSEYPSKVFISFDKACNLKCKSCRTKQYVKNCYEKEQIILYYADIINKSGWLETCDDLTIGGDGEIFMSKGYRKVLFEDADKVRKRVSIMTNGTLFTPTVWEQLEGKYDYILMSISIDATTESTYKKIRGGNFKQLMKNMEFLSELRKKNKINYVRVKMIVQEDNYREMKDFVLWAKRLGFDSVYFSPIWNWGTYSNSEFRRISIFVDKEEHKMKSKVRECLKDEIFQDPIVEMRWSQG